MSNTRKSDKNAANIDGLPVDELENLALSPEEKAEEDTEAVILAEFGKGERDVTWAVKVYRAASKGEPEPYLFTCSPTELPVIDRLRDEYGSGLYRVRVFKNNRVYRYISVSVEARKTPPAPVQVQQPSDGLAAILKQSIDTQNAIMERLLSERNRPVSNQPNTVELIGSIFGIISQAKNLFGGQPSGGEQTIEMFMRGVEAAKDLGGDKGNATMMDFLRDLIKSPMVEKMLEGVPTAPMQMPTPIPNSFPPGIGEAPIPSPQPQPQPQPPQPERNNEAPQQQDALQNQQLIQIIHNLKYLTTKAAVGADVELYADWIMDNVPIDMLKNIVNDPGALKTLTDMVPEAVPYTAWFASLLAVVKESLTDDMQGDQDDAHVQPATAAGSISNP